MPFAREQDPDSLEQPRALLVMETGSLAFGLVLALSSMSRNSSWFKMGFKGSIRGLGQGIVWM